jgi:TatD DNase family protein
MLPKQKIVDTHTHICDSAFDADRDEVLKKAVEVGVGAIIAVGENLADARRNIELADEHPMIFPAAGLYPTILDLDQAEQMHAFIRKERSKLVAIGEVGLDFWIVKEAPQKELQKEISIPE